jgi:cytochrome c oxidase cbb3-type subunit 3
MKFVNYLNSITGISIFPLIGLIIFVGFFIGMTWYVYSTDKKTLEECSSLPLDK